MRKKKKPSKIEGKEACFSNIMTIVALITLVFICRDMKKVDATKLLQEFALKSLVYGQNRQNPAKKLKCHFLGNIILHG